MTFRVVLLQILVLCAYIILCVLPGRWSLTGLAAAFFAVPFIWVLIIVLRRRKREDRERVDGTEAPPKVGELNPVSGVEKEGLHTGVAGPGRNTAHDGKPSSSGYFTPAMWLLAMTGWLVPCYGFEVLLTDGWEYQASRWYCIIFSLTVLAAGVLTLLELWFSLWHRKGYWRKFLPLVVGYTLSVGGGMFLSMYLDTLGYPGGRRGDTSFLIFCLPSVALYWLAGLFSGLFLIVMDMISKRYFTRRNQ